MLMLNVGCGGRRIPGYKGVDVAQRPAADIVAPCHQIPLQTGTVDEIMAIHLIEHMHPWDVPVALAEWHRLLKPHGRLVLELPDLMKCCANVISGVMVGGKDPDQLGMWGLYGDPRGQDPYMAHKWGWTFDTLAPVVAAAGFVDLKQKGTQYHPAGRENRDFRLQAIKPRSAES